MNATCIYKSIGLAGDLDKAMDIALQNAEKAVGKHERIISYSVSQILKQGMVDNVWCVFAFAVIEVQDEYPNG